MNVLPRLIYLFQSIPLHPSFKITEKVISSFLWGNKIPRVNLTTLQAPYIKGGLNLPNFKCYYLASQFHPIWSWLHSESSDIRWLSIEKHILKATPLKNIPFLGSKKTLSLITKEPIILSTFQVWQKAHTLLGLDISLLRKTPLWNNPKIPYPVADGTLQKLSRKGIETVSDLYSNKTLSSFQQLSSKFRLPQNNHFKFLQIRHWLQDNSVDFPYLPDESPFEKHLLDTRLSSTRGLISSIYNILIRNLPIYDRLSIKNKWQADLGCN